MADDELPFPYVLPADPNLGRCVDGHILRSLLGRGGMGAAYLATHQALSNSKCVIKLVLTEIARNPLVIVRFKVEAEALALLKHDNIVKLQNFGVLDDGQLYLRFEFIDGKSLDRYVAAQGGRLPLRKATNITFQLCGALHYAHSLGVIHRDLKPDNLMIELNPPGSLLRERVKVLDFGIAKVLTSSAEPTGSGMTIGTTRFMAPEQVTNAAGVTGRADVFSLGQIFYLILTATMPWGIPENDIAIYHLQRTQAPAAPPEHLMPAAVWKVIRRCLSINPDDRPDMRELAHELACAFEGGTDILEKVVPDWVASSPPHAQTLPRPVAVEPGPPQVSTLATNAPEQPAAFARHTPAPHAAHEKDPPTDLTVTANQRPRSLAASLAAKAMPLPAPQQTSSDSSGQLAVHPPTPVLAALPTGLVSQGFTPRPPTEHREAPLVVAAEIEMATGTPGPQPFAHAELPAVVVSHVGLLGTPVPTGTRRAQADSSGILPPRASPDAQPSSRPPEPLPVLVLPGTEQPAARPLPSRNARTAVLGVAVCVLAALATFSIVHFGVRDAAKGDGAGSSAAASAAGSASAAAVTPMAPLNVRANSAVEDADDVGSRRAQATPSSQVAATPHVTDSRRRGGSSAPATDAQIAHGSQSGSGSQERPSSPSAASPPSGSRPTVADAGRGDPGSRGPAPPTTSPAQPPAPPTTSPGIAIAQGTLHVEVEPWADVSIDGQPTSHTTPVTIRLPAGHHRLLLTKGKTQKATVDVIVKPNETTNVTRSW